MVTVMSLQTKVTVAFLAFFSIVLLHGVYTLVGQRRLLQNETRERALVLASMLAEMSLDPLLSGHFDRLERQVDSLEAHSGVLFARIINRNGRIVADTNRGNQGWIRTGFAEESPLFRLSSNSKSLNARAPIVFGTTVLGYAEVDLSLDFLNRRLGQTSFVLILALVALIAVAVAFGLYLHIQVLRPLQRVSDTLITDETREITGLIHLRRGVAREIRTVASAIDSMRSRLETYYREEQAVQRLRTLGEISVSLAHEIRNPLEAVSGAVEMIRRAPETSEHQEKFLAIIREEVDVLNRYVSEFTQYGRFDLASETIFALDDLVEDVMVLVTPLAQQQAIHLRAKRSDPGLTICASRSHIKRVLVNVLMNAIEACSQGDGIELRTAGDCDIAVITVDDSGSGVPEAIIDHVFDPFVSSRDHGLGLGLALCRSLLECYNGSISLQNRDPQGVRVCIRIPLSTSNASSQGLVL